MIHALKSVLSRWLENVIFFFTLYSEKGSENENL